MSKPTHNIQPINDNVLNLKSVAFIKDIPIFLNYTNRIDTGLFELYIKTPAGQDTSFLFIKEKKTNKICMVPLTSVASMDLS